MLSLHAIHERYGEGGELPRPPRSLALHDRPKLGLLDDAQRHLGLHNIVRPDFLWVESRNDSAEGPTIADGQNDAERPHLAAINVFVKRQVPFILRIQIERQRDVPNVQQSRQLLRHIPRRIQLLHLGHLSFLAWRLYICELPNEGEHRAVLAPVDFRSQASDLGHKLHTSLVHDHHVHMVVRLSALLLENHNALLYPGADDGKSSHGPLQALQRLAHRGGDCLGYGLRLRHGGDLESRFRPGDAVQVPPRYDADDVEDDAGIGGAVRPDLVVDPVAHQRRDSRVLDKSLPYRPPGRHPLRRHTRSSLLCRAWMVRCSASCRLASPAGRSQGLGGTWPTTVPARVRLARLRPPTPMSWPNSTSLPYHPFSPGPPTAVAWVSHVRRSSISAWMSPASVPVR